MYTESAFVATNELSPKFMLVISNEVERISGTLAVKPSSLLITVLCVYNPQVSCSNGDVLSTPLVVAFCGTMLAAIWFQ